MSVPLDRLYNFLHDHCDQDVIIYRWFPHGSRKTEDCTLLKWHSNFDQITQLPMICHDQEPLKFSDHQQGADKAGVFRHTVFHTFNFYDRILLLHSEQRSEELEKFVAAGAIPVYYWSHAVIAHDWFRYAQHDIVLKNKRIEKLFLIYNRAWTGTREYRLKFAELIIDSGLSNQCRMGFNPQDQHSHYQTHEFVNADFAVSRNDIDQYFYLNQTSNTASADFVNHDYQQTAIEVVLETLFDDNRWHLTEKALRPIACGQPFMLGAAPGSLEYLRSYGFLTFAPWIDETYDTIQNPLHRLQAMIKEMKRIAELPDHEQAALFENVNKIARLNQERFFSNEFLQQVLQEYKNNLTAAIQQAQHHKCASYYKNYRRYFETYCCPKLFKSIDEHAKLYTTDSTRVLKFT